MLKALREKRATLVADMRAIIEASEAANRDLSAEEIAAYDKLKAEHDSIVQRLERVETLEASTADLARVVPAAARGNGDRAGSAARKRGPSSKASASSCTRCGSAQPTSG
jgi:HK97 family phage major capsid protein